MDAARDGRLTTDSDRSITATRLIQSAEGQAHFGRFCRLVGINIETVARNTSLYPEFTPEFEPICSADAADWVDVA